MKVVVVESPAKAKTINRYLGDGYKVLASYGHVCDLPSKDGSVLPDNDFEMKWQVSTGSEKHLKEIRDALKNAEKLVLATDPDREGEAISWHVLEQLRQKNKLDGIAVERVVFNEVTKSAILTAMENPRQLDLELINAYRARRALDYLVGFSISPVLWRKLPGSRSAGRVQSVALRLICEREAEIEAFVSEEYWSIEADLALAGGDRFSARLTHLDGNKLGKLDIKTEDVATTSADRIRAATLAVQSVETRRVKRNPQPPFTTSTLQQEASRKLGFSASRTMQIAQKLYEGISIGSETTGLITYMRTDGVQLGTEAISAIRTAIGDRFGANFVPTAPRAYKTKAANAQEAHEAIRPTDITRHPDDIRPFLDHDQIRLYELIWKRTIASQMASAELDQTGIDIGDAAGNVTLRASGQVIVFAGFLSVYQEGRDSTADSEESSKADDEDDNSRLLPQMAKGDQVSAEKVTPEQHFTQPPPRFTDASLVKRMEELGIGRPSTYASIIQVLQNRNYVRKDRARFIPEDRGRLVSTFLGNFFDRYVEYDFTAQLETQLDEVSAGTLDWTALLQNFWRDFKQAIDGTKDLTITNVLDVLDEELGPHFFKADKDGNLLRACPTCADGRLGLKLGKFGAFVGCSNYPDCKFTRQLNNDSDSEDENGQPLTDKVLGLDPATSLPVMLRVGPYGPYVQIGAVDATKPKRASLPQGTSAASIDLEAALGLLALPRDIGPHPETGEMIQAGIGRFGPYLKYKGKFSSLPAEDDVLTVGINRAVDLLAEAAKKAGRLLGQHPDGGDIHVKAGRFGPYVEHNKLRATLGKAHDMADLTLETALALLAAKAAKGGTKKPAAKKAAAKKTAAKKTATKKSAAKKAAKKAAPKSTAPGKSD